MSGYFNAVMSETWTNLATGPAPPTSASSSGGTPQSMPAGQLSGLGLLEALPTRLDGPTAPASVPAFGLASSGPQATTGSVLEFDIDTSDHGLRSSRGGRTSRGGAGPGLSGCVLGGSLATGYENDRDAVTGRAEITLPAFEDMLRYLYGIPPRMEHSSVKSLLVTASYFGGCSVILSRPIVVVSSASATAHLLDALSPSPPPQLLTFTKVNTRSHPHHMRRRAAADVVRVRLRVLAPGP